VKPLATRHKLPVDPGYHELPAGELELLRFGLARVSRGRSIELDTQDRDTLLVVLEAPEVTQVIAGGRQLRLPPRRCVFDDLPSAVYAPAGASLELRGGLLAAVFQTPVRGPLGGGAFAILGEEIDTVERGRENFTRRIRIIVPGGRADMSMIAGETLSPPGNWSSSPPHKHDRQAPPEETRMEEVYLFRLRPRQGFGLQHSYHSGGPSRTFAVGDLDVVAIPAGYHPVVAAPGYELYYLWCLAGLSNELCWHADPAHAWVDPS
jgi:5-deoxy-glucuronate isomerase